MAASASSYKFFVKTIDCKSFELAMHSATTGKEIKQELSLKEDFKDENLEKDYLFLYNEALFADHHRLEDHQVVSNETLNLLKIDQSLKKTLIASFEKEEFLAQSPSKRLTYLISGFIRNHSSEIEFSDDLTKFMIPFLGNKYPTFDILVYDKIIKVSEKWTVANLKKKINIAPYHNVRYDGKHMVNYRNLEYYKVTYKKHQRHKLKYFCHQVMLKTDKGKLIILDVRQLELVTVGEAKLALFEQEGIPVEQQKWKLYGKRLKDGKNLKFDYAVDRDTVIDLIIVKQYVNLMM